MVVPELNRAPYNANGEVLEGVHFQPVLTCVNSHSHKIKVVNFFR